MVKDGLEVIINILEKATKSLRKIIKLNYEKKIIFSFMNLVMLMIMLKLGKGYKNLAFFSYSIWCFNR